MTAESHDPITVHHDPERALRHMQELLSASSRARDQFSAASDVNGQCYLIDSPGEIPCVLEFVFAVEGADHFGTLYRYSEVFEDLISYSSAREELIRSVHELYDAPVGELRIMCPVRKRHAWIKELATHQLVQVIESAVEYANQTEH